MKFLQRLLLLFVFIFVFLLTQTADLFSISAATSANQQIYSESLSASTTATATATPTTTTEFATAASVVDECPENCVAGGLPGPPSVELVVLFGRRSFCQLRRLARSVAVWDRRKLLPRVTLVWTWDQPFSGADADQVAGVTLLFGADRSVRTLTTISSPADRGGFQFQGWYEQMINKLRVAESVDAEFYWVLDAKDVLIRPLLHSDLFDQCNRGLSLYVGDVDWLPGPHDWWLVASLLQLSLPDELTYDEARARCRQISAGPGFGVAPSITPKLLHAQTVRDLVAQLHRRANVSLMSAFCSGATEFMLYSVYTLLQLEKNEGGANRSCLHAFRRYQETQGPVYVKVWRTLNDRSLAHTQALLRPGPRDPDWDPLVFAVQRGALNTHTWLHASKQNQTADLLAMKQQVFELFRQRQLLEPDDTPESLAVCLSGHDQDELNLPKWCKQTV